MKLFTTDKETTKANCALCLLKIALSKRKRESFKTVKNKKIVFLDNSGCKVFVIKEKNRYIPVREAKSGSLLKLRFQKLKARNSRTNAQRDLFEYAQLRGWMRI
jgi:hypothetical protein